MATSALKKLQDTQRSFPMGTNTVPAAKTAKPISFGSYETKQSLFSVPPGNGNVGIKLNNASNLVK